MYHISSTTPYLVSSTDAPPTCKWLEVSGLPPVTPQTTATVLLGDSITVNIQVMNVAAEKVTTADATDCTPSTTERTSTTDGGVVDVLSSTGSRSPMAGGVHPKCASCHSRPILVFEKRYIT